MRAAILGGIALGGCAMFSAPPPDTAARDAHRAEVAACKVYDLLPAEKHKPDVDRVCRMVRIECQDPGTGGSP